VNSILPLSHNKAFWPGALTIIARAATAPISKNKSTNKSVLILPPSVISSDGYVALNCPSHPLSRAILRSIGDDVPLATVSSCQYTEIPATRSCQVMADLKSLDGLSILNGEDKRELFAVAPCDFGIKSTVIRIDECTRTINVLRRGAISQKSIERALFNTLSSKSVHKNKTTNPSSSSIDKLKILTAVLRKWTVDFRGLDGPGRFASVDSSSLVPHENIPINNGVCETPKFGFHEWHSVIPHSIQTNRSSTENQVLTTAATSNDTIYAEMGLSEVLHGGVVVIDFGRTLSNCGINENLDEVLSYKDLSPCGSIREGGRHLFLFLRWLKLNRHKVSKVLLADISTILPDDEHIGGLVDQISLHCRFQGIKRVNTVITGI